MSLLSLDLASLIADFGETVTVTAKASPTFSGGFAVAGAETPSSITASVQPVGGRELSLLPELIRESSTIKLYTESSLEPLSTLSWQGRTYEIHMAQDWSPTGSYYKYFGKLVID